MREEYVWLAHETLGSGASDADKKKMLAALMNEVKSLTKRTQFAETAYLSMLNDLDQAPDPGAPLSAAAKSAGGRRPFHSFIRSFARLKAPQMGFTRGLHVVYTWFTTVNHWWCEAFESDE